MVMGAIMLIIGGCDSVVLIGRLESWGRSPPPAVSKYAIGLGVEHELDMDSVRSGTQGKSVETGDEYTCQATPSKFSNEDSPHKLTIGKLESMNEKTDLGDDAKQKERG
jgi:hypothetical protein